MIESGREPCYPAMDQWIAAVAELKRGRWFTVKGMAHFFRNTMGSAMHTWRAASWESRRRRALLSNACKKLSASGLRRRWNGWRRYVAERVAEARAVRRAVKSWQSRFYAGAWRKWKSHVNSTRVALRLAAHNFKVKFAVANRDAARRAWTNWRVYCVEYRRLAGSIGQSNSPPQYLFIYTSP